MKYLVLLSLAAVVCQSLAAEEAAAAAEKTREKRSVGYGDDRSGYGYDSHAHRGSGGYGQQRSSGYGQQRSGGYGEERKTHGYVETHKVVEKKYYKPKPKQCYQCAYSPPKTYYDKKVYVEEGKYKKHYDEDRYAERGYHNEGYHGYEGGRKSYADNKSGGRYGGYTKKTVVPVPYTVYGGWDKCIGPFTKYEAKKNGVDEWDCHSNCYTRRDPNGDVFRGCYKGEYEVDPYRVGCSKQAGSIWCFCEGDKCNNGPSPGGYH